MNEASDIMPKHRKPDPNVLPRVQLNIGLREPQLNVYQSDQVPLDLTFIERVNT
jgi:hypothetical protein